MAQRKALTDFASRKGPPQAEPSPAPPAAKAGSRVGIVVRLLPDAHQQLRLLSVTERTTAHALVVEGLNAVFAKRGLPPIA